MGGWKTAYNGGKRLGEPSLRLRGDDLNGWSANEVWTAGVRSRAHSTNPDVWTDGSLVRDDRSGVCCGGSGVFAFASGSGWFYRSWEHLDLLPLDLDSGSERARLYFSVPKGAALGVIAALQAARPIHLGVDNANVVGHVGRILAGKKSNRPLELLVDGDLLALVEKLGTIRGPGTTAISKVKGHADEGLVRGGRVRKLDKIGNDMADLVADLGRRRVDPGVCEARKSLWYPIILDLHWLFIAIAMAVVNEDGKGGIAHHPMVWSAGERLKRRRPVEAVRDYAMLPGPQRL